jgi:competence protein ComEC
MPWLVACWIIGIFVGMATEQPTRVWPAAVALSLATLFALLGSALRARLWVLPLGLLCAISGFGIGPLPQRPVPPGLYRLEGDVLAVRPREADQRVLLELREVEALVTKRPADLRGRRVIVTFPRDARVPPGALVRALVRLRPPTVFHNTTPHPAWPPELIPAATGRSVADSPPEVIDVPWMAGALAGARTALRNGITRSMPDDVEGLVIALVLGDGGATEETQRDIMRDAGMAHVLAVSGMHVAMVGLFLVGTLRRVFVRLDVLRPDRLSALAGIPCVLIYGELSGGSASGHRAAFTACLALVVTALGRRPEPMPLMAGACLVIAFLDPRVSVSPGFVLSVVATAAILTAPSHRDARFPELMTAWSITCRTTLATAPVTLWCFSGIPILGLLANLLVAPLGSGILLALGNVHAVLATVCPPLASLTATPLAIICRALVHGTSIYSSPGWGLGLPPLSLGEGLCVGAAVVALLGTRGRFRVVMLALALMGFVGSELGLRHTEQPTGTLRITFLDVGQGDGAIVDLPNGEALLIDAGGGVPDPGEQVIAPMLAARRRRELRAAMISHPHPDHFGGLAAVLRAVAVREVWDTGQGPGEHPDAPYTELLRGLSTRGTRVLGPPQLCGARQLGGVELDLIWPCPSFDAALDPNDNSFVMRLRFGERSVLFVGDAEHEAEEALVALGERVRADVLKVGHHGSRTSSTEAFLNVVQPSLAVASQGRDNAFGHPHDDVVERFEQLGIPLLLTAQLGGITLETDGHEWEVQTTLTPPEAQDGTAPVRWDRGAVVSRQRPPRRGSPPPPPPHAP